MQGFPKHRRGKCGRDTALHCAGLRGKDELQTLNDEPAELAPARFRPTGFPILDGKARTKTALD